jgi:7,8-dihydropterin-6-yl-methyl-4-(beta-D-ribofuranosyl)aminobenzene 5'-phosphate synthase
MEVRTITISENTAQTIDLLGEWGLSILIEVDGLRILFDTGASISAAHNADVMGQDLSTVDKIVLSHGHFDHTGGLRQVLTRMRNTVEVIAHPDVWAPKYGGSAAMNIYRYVGVPFQKDELETRGASFVLDRGPTWITDNIVTTGEVPMVTEYERIDAALFVKQGEQFVPDPVLDDQAIIIKTDHGLVVIAGCAHRGIVNTLLHAQELTGEEHIHAVLGGIHLHRASEEQQARTIAAFKELGVERIGVSHCTGLLQSARIAHEFGDSFFFNNAGTVASFAIVEPG